MRHLNRHLRPDEYEVAGEGWRVDLAPCDPKVRLFFGSVEGEIDYEDALRLAHALADAVEASRQVWPE